MPISLSWYWADSEQRMSHREHLSDLDSLGTDPYIAFVLLVPALSHTRDPRDSSTTVLSAKDCSNRIQGDGAVDSQNSLVEPWEVELTWYWHRREEGKHLAVQGQRNRLLAMERGYCGCWRGLGLQVWNR